jgi:uncharacterized integral membrane protein
MSDQVTPEQESAIRRRQTVRLTVIAVIVIAAVAVAIDNRQDVTLSYVFGDRQAPLIIALVVAFALGAIVGRLTARRTRDRES